jgi:hypothetical protein
MHIAEAYLDQKVERLRAELTESVRHMTDEQINALEIAKAHALAQNEARMSRSALDKARSSGAIFDLDSWTMVVDEDTAVKSISHSPAAGTDKP